jgi:hydroxyacylglutathione hydrolase
MPTVHAIPAFSDNYIWALIPDNENRVVIVDPGDAAPVQSFLAARGLDLGAILITHHHPDHTGGIGALTAEYDVPVYGPARERQAIAGLTARLADGDQIDIDWLGCRFDVIDVPGHTIGHIALVGGGILFSGDTLFHGGCGKLFEGSAGQMRASLERLRALPDDTSIYCGHEYTLKNLQFAAAVEPENADIAARIEQVQALRDRQQPSLPSTIGLEKRVNPFMRWDVPDIRRAARERHGSDLDGPDAVFAVLRQWKDDF